MTGDAYENAKSQIGGCGIWCGSCALGNGSLRALIEGLETVLDHSDAAKGRREYAEAMADAEIVFRYA